MIALEYTFDRFEVNGTVYTENEISLNVTEDLNVVAYYKETQNMVQIKNTGTEDKIVKVISTTEITIPAGQTVTIEADVDDVIEI